MSTPTPAAPRVVIYARQSVAQAQGIAQQEAEVRQFCEGRGWPVVEVISDDATSATKVRGPGTGWRRMLDMLKAGEADAVVSVAVDRMLRTIRDLPDLRDTGARIVTVRGGIDAADPIGAMVLGMMVLFAEMEIANKEARRQPFDRAQAAAGHPTPGKPPYGYRWIPKSQRDEDGRRWAVVPEQADAVRFLFEQALDMRPNVNLAKIASAANDAGLTAGKDAAWRSTTVRKVLLNPAYAGLLVPLLRDDASDGGKARPKGRASDFVGPDACTPGAWEALVTVDQLKVVRHHLLDPERRTNGGATAAKYLSTGLAVCGRCIADGHSEAESGLRSGWDRNGHRILRCARFHMSRRAQPVEEYLEGLILWRLGLPDAATLLEPKPDADTVALEAQRATLLERLSNLHDMAEVGSLPVPEYAQRVQAVQEGLGTVNARIEAAYAPTPLAAFRGSERTPEDVWQGLSISQRRAVAQALLPRVEVFPVGRGRTTATVDEVAASVAVEFADTDPHQIAYADLWAEVQTQWFAGDLSEYASIDEAFSWAIESVDIPLRPYPYNRTLTGPLAADVQASVAKAIGG